MRQLFKILFWFIGYVYEEGEPYSIGEEYLAQTFYAHKPEQTKEQGFAIETILGRKYGTKFEDRWLLFKTALNPQKYS